MPFNAGENVGPYRIIEQLGQGGMATVYKAYHPALDRYVAIKALHPAILEDASFQARFEREAKVVAKLEHPCIVPIYDYAEHKGQPYLVMKYIEGETLKARLKRGSLSKQEAVKIVRAVGEALSYAHKRGYLHRDIKPSNILLSPDGSIYLADFGLARIAEAGASTLSGDMLMGTPHYISPEQARGERDLDEGTDVYSFGVVLYEIIVGRVPFTADTPFSIIHDHIYTPLPMPREVNPAVTEPVERVLLKALAKERGDRFASVKELVAAFDHSITAGDIGVLFTRTVPKPAVKTEPAPPKQAATPVVEAVPAQPQPEAQAISMPSAAPASPMAAKRGWGWLWVVGGLMLTCLMLLTFLAAVNWARVGSQPLPADTVLEDSPRVSAPVEEAIGPDAEGHLGRAKELLDKGDAMGAYEMAVKAGDLFLEDQHYVKAVDSYVWAMEISGEFFRADTRVKARLTQALFLGAPEEAMWELTDQLYKILPEGEIIQIAEARAKLHAGLRGEALMRIDPILAVNPDNHLAKAVMVEYYIMGGDFQAAEEVLGRLLDEPSLQPWLRGHLEKLKGSIP